MDCLDQEALERIAGGSAEPDERAHIDSCADCTRELEHVRGETALLVSLRNALCAPAATRQQWNAFPEEFRLIRSIGRGGQGEIHEAVQLSTGRRVALKLLLQGQMATTSQRARFLREIRLAHRLQHPNLVTVHAAGETAEGVLYLAMELVDGRHFDAWADELRSHDPAGATQRILGSFLEVCDAVACAHAAGIVHRDIKPSNVLVDLEGRARVLDLGLAKHLHSGADRGPTNSFHTRTGELVGSLAWMSPERLAGDEEESFPSDVYSLGLLLHRVILGREAHKDAASRNVLSGGAESADVLEDTSSLQEACRSVLRRALAVAPSERYAHAGELADELRRTLQADPPVRPADPRRTRIVAGASVAIALAVALAWIAPTRIWTQAAHPTAARMLAILERSSGAAALDEFLTATARLETLSSGALGDWALPEPGSVELGHWRLAASQVWRRFPALLRIPLDPGHDWSYLSAAESGDWLGLATSDGRVELLQTSGARRTLSYADLGVHGFGHLLLSHDGRHALSYMEGPGGVPGYSLLALSPPGAELKLRELVGLYPAYWAKSRSLIAATSAEREALILIDPELEDPLETRVLPDDFRFYSACFLDDDSKLLLVDREGRTLVHTIGSDEPLGEGAPVPSGASVLELDNGHWLLIEPRLAVFDTERGVRHQLHWSNNPVRALPLAGSSLRALVSDEVQGFRAARFSDAPEHWIRRDPWRDTSSLQQMASMGAGQLVATLNIDRTLTVFSAETVDLPRMLSSRTSAGTLHGVRALPDGSGWVASSRNELLFFERGETHALTVAELGDLILQVDVGSDGRVYFSTQRGRVGSTHRSGEPGLRWHAGHPGMISALALDPSGSRLAAADEHGHITVEPVDGLAPPLTTRLRAGQPRVPRLAFDPHGRWIAGTVREGRVFWWVPGSDPILAEPGHFTTAHGLAIHPQTGHVVSGHEASRIAVWEPLALRPLRTHTLSQASPFSVWALTFSPDGRYLAAGSGRRIFVLEWPSCRTLFDAEEHDLAIFSLAFHPTLPVLASAGEVGELMEWDFRAADHLLDRVRKP